MPLIALAGFAAITNTVKPRNSTTLCSLQLVAVFERIVNKEFLLTDFRGRNVRVTLYRGLTELGDYCC